MAKGDKPWNVAEKSSVFGHVSCGGFGKPTGKIAMQLACCDSETLMRGPAKNLNAVSISAYACAWLCMHRLALAFAIVIACVSLCTRNVLCVSRRWDLFSGLSYVGACRKIRTYVDQHTDARKIFACTHETHNWSALAYLCAPEMCFALAAVGIFSVAYPM